MDKLIILLTEIFFKLEKEGKDGFMILKLTVPCKVLSDLYNVLSKVDVMPIEQIEQDKKIKYWNIAK